MIGCIYELNGEIAAYPNKDRLLKKYPDVKILKEVENINLLQQELLKFKGISIKEKQFFQDQRPYTHTYRLNCNTIFCAYSQEELDKLS